MKKTFIILILIVVGIKYSVGYLFSDKFQQYADKTKQPWTCKFTNFLAEFELMMSHYDKAVAFFQRTEKRCPESPEAEDAVFRIGISLDKKGAKPQALSQFNKFIEMYPDSERVTLARKKIQQIRVQLP